MQTSETIDLINAVEERFPVETWTVGDLRIWPLVRFELYMLNAKHSNLSPQMRERKRPGRILRGLRLGKSVAGFGRLYLRDRARNVSPAPAQTVFLTNGIACTRLPRGWQDNICDPLIRILEEETISYFLMNSSRSAPVPRLTPSMFVRPQLDAAALSALIQTRKLDSMDRVLDQYAEFQSFLGARDSSIVIPGPTNLCKKVAIIEARSRFFLKLFRTIQPVIGFQVCYYGGLGLAFDLACHRYGIPSVDLQHGIQGELHFAYGRWNRVPREGYSLLPSAFWCWSRAETDAIERWNGGAARHRAIVGGNLALQSWRHDVELARDFDPEIRELKRRSGKAAHILYTLRDNDAETELREVLDLVRASADSCHWWIRLHPAVRERLGEVQRLFRVQGLESVNVADATSLPLYVLLKHVDLHVTGRSTTVIEAELFGVPSVLIDPEAAEVYAEQIRSGWALAAHGREAVLSAIDAQLRRKTPPTPHSSPEPLDADASRRVLLALIEESRASRPSERVSSSPEP